MRWSHIRGTKVLRETREGDDPVRLGEEVGETLKRGGDAILEEVYGGLQCRNNLRAVLSSSSQSPENQEQEPRTEN